MISRHFSFKRVLLELQISPLLNFYYHNSIVKKKLSNDLNSLTGFCFLLKLESIDGLYPNQPLYAKNTFKFSLLSKQINKFLEYFKQVC